MVVAAIMTTTSSDDAHHDRIDNRRIRESRKVVKLFIRMSHPDTFMPSTAVPDNSGRARRPSSWLVAAMLALAVGVVYGTALRGPFIFDDSDSIRNNPTIVRLWPLIGGTNGGPLNPESDLPVSGRPLVNLSFALNYHFGGLDPFGYRACNVVLHVASALLLWAIVRRTLRLPRFGGRFEPSAGWLAFVVSLLWALHPLQTEAVIYVTQRTELMVAFFYLATLYCSLRYWATFSPADVADPRKALLEARPDGWHRIAWLSLAVLSCLCGMACKEVMVSAPLVVLLFERTFVAGGLTNALRRSWPLYVGLASTELLLLLLNIALREVRLLASTWGCPRLPGG